MKYKILRSLAAVLLLLSAGLLQAKDYFVFNEGLIRDITPRGWLLEYLQRMRDGMTGHPEALSYPYNTCLWAGDIPRNGNYGQDWWRYEQTAYYTDGLLRLGYLLNDEKLIQKGEEGVVYTIRHPQSNGRIGNGVINSLWPQAVFFRAMKAYYEYRGDSRVRTVLRNNYNSMTNTDLTNGRRHILNLEGLLWLYGQQSLAALLTKAKNAYRTGGFEFDAAEAGSPDFTYLHGVTYCEMLKVPMLLYAYTGDESYLQIALNAERKLERDHLLPDGVPSSGEYTVGHDVDQVHETCDITDYTWSLGYFLTATGEAEWADRIERAVFNAAPACHTKDFRSLQYFSSLNQILCTGNSDNTYFKRGSTWQAYRPTHETECCAGNIHRLMPNFASRLWMRGREGEVVAAMYAPSQFVFEADGDSVRIDEETAYPFEGCIRFHFSMKKPTRIPFTFRIPGWCTQAEVLVNGVVSQSQSQGQSQGQGQPTFVTLDREFADGDVVTLRLPMQPRLVAAPHDQGQYVECGPLLYAFAIPQQRTEDTKTYSNMNGKVPENPDFKCWSITPNGKWNYGIPEGVEGLTLVTDSALLTTGYPFDLQQTPVSIEVPVQEIKWDITSNRYNPETPSTNTVEVTGGKSTLRFVPYGSTELRLTVFPLISTATDLTDSLLTNPDFEMTSRTQFNHGGEEKKTYLPYGWRVRGTLTGSSYGINRDAVNHHGENVCWYSTTPFPSNFQLYQTISASKLKAGRYRVTCQLWCCSEKLGTTRLFANNNVQYFGKESEYAPACLDANEQATFAGYRGFTNSSPFILRDMEVVVDIEEGQSLTLGIRSNNCKADGTLSTSADGTGWFKVDNFRIERLPDDGDALPAVRAENASATPFVYDLSGRSVSLRNGQMTPHASRPGIYVTNGKKVCVP